MQAVTRWVARMLAPYNRSKLVILYLVYMRQLGPSSGHIYHFCCKYAQL